MFPCINKFLWVEDCFQGTVYVMSLESTSNHGGTSLKPVVHDSELQNNEYQSANTNFLT